MTATTVKLGVKGLNHTLPECGQQGSAEKGASLMEVLLLLLLSATVWLLLLRHQPTAQAMA